MSKYNNILNLIKTMSNSEKRHFLLLSSLYKGDRNYLVLYREIEKIVIEKEKKQGGLPDETLLHRRLERLGIPLERLSDLRAYLYQRLLQSLRMQQQEDTNEFTAMYLLQEGKLLHRRGLFEAATDRYTAALAVAEEYKYESLATEAMKGLVTIYSQFDAPDYVQKMTEKLEKLEQLAHDSHDTSQAFTLHYKSFLLIRTQKNAFSKPDEQQKINLQNHPLLQANFKTDSFFTSVYRHAALACLELVTKNWIKACEYYQSIVSNWPDNLRKEHLRVYIIFMSNYLTYRVKTKQYDNVEEHLKTLEDIHPSNLDDKAELFQNLVYLKQLFLLNQAELEVAAALSTEIEEGLKKYASKINKARERTLRYNMMLTWFALADYDKALIQANCLVEMRRSSHRQDLHSISKIFQLIILFEQDNHSYLDIRVKGIIQNLQYNADLHDFERTVLFYLGKLAKTRYQTLPSEKSLAESKLLIAFKEELLKLQEHFKATKQNPIGFQEIMIWLRSKIEGQSFRELMFD